MSSGRVLAGDRPEPVSCVFGCCGRAMQLASPADSEARAWLVLLAACGVAWFAVLGLRPLFNPDEGRYAQIPAEMLASGDFILPRLDGVVYLEKPPLQYWTTALALRVFGHNEWAARFSTAASAALALVFIWLLGRRAFGAEHGLMAAAMTASMLLYVFMGQLITLDMALSCFLTIAVVSFCLGQLERERAPAACRGWMLACWAAMAAATLTKGLVGLVIPGSVLVLYTLLQRDRAAWRHLHLVKGLALYALIVLPWFLLVERAHRGALDFLIVHEHFQRYLTTVHERYQPWWYFLPILAAGSLPWLPQAARALLTGWRASRPPGSFDPARVLWVGAAFVLVFFSLSDSKLAPYVVPVLPLLALLGAGRGPAAVAGLRQAALLQAALGVALAAGIVLYGRRTLDAEAAATLTALRPWLIAVTGVLLLGGLGAWRLGTRSFGAAARALAASGFAVALLLIVGGAGSIAARWSGRGLLAAAGPLAPGAPLYAVRCFDWTAPFYTGRFVTPVEWRGELDYGLKFEPDRGLAGLPEFTAIWRELPSGYALLPLATGRRLAASGLPMRSLAQDFNHVLVSRQ